MRATLGPYTLLDLLGEGGMGEVYRARDTRLGRDVAIKILPAELDDQSDRRRRFETEARAVAALSHPNVLALYDIGTDEGTAYLVTELLDGATLRAHLARPLALDRALSWATQIASGLAAAHGAGIIHRDLKPENVFVTASGAIKILDFGLAKAAGPMPLEPPDASSPTHLSPVHTEAGVVLGTPGFMAPEQVRGQVVDSRTDIFAFGCVLFEMLTGRRAFDGATTMDVFSAILHAQPEMPPDMAPALGAILRRCLAKAPADRFQSAADLAFALSHLVAAPPVPRTPSGPGADARVARWRRIAAAALVIALGALATLVVNLPRLWTPASVDSGGVTPTMTALTSTGDASLAQLSPDGKFVAYVRSEGGRTSVWVRQLGSGSAVAIVPATEETVWGLAVTPDSSFVDFVRSRSAQSSQVMDLWRVPILGGTPRRVADDVATLPGWSPDGRQMAYVTSSPQEERLVTAQPDGSGARVIASRTRPDRFTSLKFSSRPDTRPVWFPDSRSIAVLGMDEERGQGVYQVISIDVETGAETELRATSFAPRGGMVLGRDGGAFTINAGRMGLPQLVTVRFGDGAETPVTNDLAAYEGVSSAGDAVVTTRRQTITELLVMDAAGRSGRRIGRELPAAVSGLTWVGDDRLLFASTLEGGAGIWSTDLSGAKDRIVSSGAFPAVSADGRTLTFFRGDLWRSDVDGRNAVRIATGASHQVSSDGSRVFYISSVSGATAVWVVDAGGRPRQVTSIPVLTINPPAISPDERFLAFFAADETAVIMPIDGGEPVRRIPRRPTRLQWTPDGRGLAYVDAAGTNIWVQPISGQAPFQLTSFDDRKRISYFCWSPSGQQVAVARAVTTSDIVLLSGVR